MKRLAQALPHRSEVNRREADGRRARANELRAAGWRYVDIAAEIGVSYATVYRLCNPDARERYRRRDREREELQARTAGVLIAGLRLYVR